MFPWLWINALTKVRFPLSGAVAQDLSTDAFFDGIQPGAGVPGIEKRVFAQASYGKQLGWLTDVLLGAIDVKALQSDDAREAMAKLTDLRDKVETIKAEHRQDRFDAATTLLDQIRADSPAELRRVLSRYVDVI